MPLFVGINREYDGIKRTYIDHIVCITLLAEYYVFPTGREYYLAELRVVLLNLLYSKNLNI